MTPADATDAPLSDDLTIRVLAITGVDRVFPPTATAARLPHRVTALAPRTPEHPSKVDVSNNGGTTVITARIATRRESHTPQTARQVADTFIQRLLPGQDAAVSIHIAQIT
jgi:hypothetical protein